MISRITYLELLKKRKWDSNIKVITGIRRCGKSVLLFDIFKNYLLSKGIKENNIIEVKLDRIEDIQLRNPFFLYDKISIDILSYFFWCDGKWRLSQCSFGNNP